MRASFDILRCNDCGKVLGRYNRRYYTDERIGEVIRANHHSHVIAGHDIEVRPEDA